MITFSFIAVINELFDITYLFLGKVYLKDRGVCGRNVSILIICCQISKGLGIDHIVLTESYFHIFNLFLSIPYIPRGVPHSRH